MTLASVREMLDRFEAEYGMSTAEMRALFRTDPKYDTPDWARWLILARLLDSRRAQPAVQRV